MPTNTQVNNRLTITLDENFHFIIAQMRNSFPLLKDNDLVKMAVGGFYSQNHNLFLREPDNLEKQAINNYIQKPELIGHEESIKFLNKLKKATTE